MKPITNDQAERVSVIGLGAMGSALARTFLQKGYQVTVWNRAPEKTVYFKEAGATIASSAAAAIQASPLAVMCVSDYMTANKILQQADTTEALRDRVLVQLSTGTPAQAREQDAWLQQQGAHPIGGAILAWPSQIGGETTTILVSAPTQLFQQQEALLRSLAGNLTYMGDEPGSSAALFMAALAYLAGNWIGFTHGALVCESEGLRAADFGLMIQAMASIMGDESKHMGEVIQHNRYTSPESTVKTTGLDLHLLVQHAREAGINAELPGFSANLFQRAIDAGFGEEEHAAIFKVLQPS
jgi:3-hydroxyisobutyrate dehydrogenase-like beta-hydroxyacid dehydrogenase